MEPPFLCIESFLIQLYESLPIFIIDKPPIQRGEDQWQMQELNPGAYKSCFTVLFCLGYLFLSEVHSSVGWVSYFKENSWGCICKILRDMLPVGSGRVRNFQLKY